MGVQLYVIETVTAEITVYAMDVEDAVRTSGVGMQDILCIKHYEGRTTETLH